jgi:hypothetical protein
VSGRVGSIAGFLEPSTLFKSPAQLATAWVTPYATDKPGSQGEMIGTGHGFGRLAVSEEAVWVTSAASKTLARIDRRSGQVTTLAELKRAPIAVATGRDAVWVICTNGWLWRFAADGSGEGVARLGGRAREIACDGNVTWVLHADGQLGGVDQQTGEVAVEGKVRRGGRGLTAVGGSIVVLSGRGRSAIRVAPATGQVEAEAKLPARGVRAAVLDGTLWVACIKSFRSRWGALVPVDLGSMTTGPQLKLPDAPRALAADDEHLWVACGRRGDKKSRLLRVAPEQRRFAPWGEAEWTIYDLAVAGDQLFAAMGVALAGPAASDGFAGSDGGGGHGGGGHGGGHGGS